MYHREQWASRGVPVTTAALPDQVIHWLQQANSSHSSLQAIRLHPRYHFRIAAARQRCTGIMHVFLVLKLTLGWGFLDFVMGQTVYNAALSCRIAPQDG